MSHGSYPGVSAFLPFGFDWATMWVLDFYFYYYFGSDALSLSDIDVEKTILS